MISSDRVLGLWAVLAILVFLVAALSAMVPLLTGFQFYDDEGYMLVSLAHYVKEGHLYTQTFSQYGPFYFYAQGIFFQLLHLPVNHDMGRLVTLVYWMASSLLATVVIYRLSKSIFLACAAGLCCTLVGLVLTNEPGHPQWVVLLLYMVAACLSVPPPSGRYDLRLFLLGSVGAALTFTKVNVGVFYIAGLAHALICVLPSGRIRSIGIGLTLAYVAASPWLLMHSSFDHGFRRYFLLATVTGIVTFACGALIQFHYRLPIRAALWSVAGLLAGTILIIIATLLQGMSLDSLIWGVILNPLHHPKVFYITPYMSRFDLSVALILAAGVVCLRLLAHRLTKSLWLDVLRCVAGVGSISLLLLQNRIEWVVPLLPLTLMPRSDWERDTAAPFSRLFITDMAVTQFLVPYPVAGSLRGVADAPMILWAFLCISDGIAGLRAGSYRLSQALRLDAVIGGTVLVGLAGNSIALSARSQFPPASTMLKGSEWLHLPPEQTTQFEAIVRNVSANCRTLFTMPGMGSFNIWSGVPTPNGWNLTAWMKGISSERQAEILGIMRSDSHVCAILNRPLARKWGGDEDDGYLAQLPLARYVMTDMPKIAQFGDYEIRIHPHRSSPWFGDAVSR